eukprot:g2368.t1
MGRYNEQVQQTLCKACQLGQFQVKIAQQACTQCQTGFYAPVTGSIQCRLCAPGKTTEIRGASKVEDCTCPFSACCGPGTFLDNATVLGVPTTGAFCSNCPVGQFQDLPSQYNCIGCPAGKYQALEGQTFCVGCAPGKHGTMLAQHNETAACAACASGQHQPEVGARRCAACPAGSAFYCPEGSATALAVDIGHYTVPEGPETAGNRTSQTPCGPGFYCQRGVRLPCPEGRLCRDDGRTTRIEGPDGKSSQVRITVQERCRDSEYAFNGTACVPCPPDGAECNDGVIKLTEGYWYDKSHGSLEEFWYNRHHGLEDARGKVTENMGLYRCPRAGSCFVEPGTGMPLCAENHYGALCAVCVEGYYSTGQVEGCKMCPSSGRIAGSVIAFFFALFVLYKGGRRAWKKGRERYPDMDLTRIKHEMPQIIKLVTGMYQVMGSFQESFEAVPWPESYRACMDFLSTVVSFNVFSSPVFACATAGNTFAKRFLWQTCCVLMVCLALVAMLAHAERYKEHRVILKKRRTTLWNVLLPFLFLVYPSVSKTVILMLRCRDIDGRSYLLADYSVRCDVPSYYGYQALAVFFVMLYPIGIPVLWSALLFRNLHQLPPDWWPRNMEAEEAKAFTKFRSIKGNEWAERSTWRLEVWAPQMKRAAKYEARFGFLFNAYKHRYYYFESVMSFYKLAMTTLVVFVSGADGGSGTTLKILYAMFAATCLMAAVAFLQPYKDADVLSVETMVNLELLFVLFAALYLQQTQNASLLAGIFLVLLIFMPMIAVCVLLSRSVRRELDMNKAIVRNVSSSRRLGRGGSRNGLGGGGRAQLLGRTETFNILNPLSKVFQNDMGKMMLKTGKFTPQQPRQSNEAEQRRDPTNGGLYTRDEFLAYYNGTAEWDAAGTEGRGGGGGASRYAGAAEDGGVRKARSFTAPDPHEADSFHSGRSDRAGGAGNGIDQWAHLTQASEFNAVPIAMPQVPGPSVAEATPTAEGAAQVTAAQPAEPSRAQMRLAALGGKLAESRQRAAKAASKWRSKWKERSVRAGGSTHSSRGFGAGLLSRWRPGRVDSGGGEFGGADDNALPAPWVACHDDNGNMYYYNPDTDESTWTKPALLPPRPASDEVYTPRVRTNTLAENEHGTDLSIHHGESQSRLV